MTRKIEVIICSHISDLDGILSAAIASIKYPKAEISFHNYGLDQFEDMFKQVVWTIRKAGRKGIVIISDLGINPDMEDLCLDALRNIVKMHWDVVWVDHHPWSKGIVASLRQVSKIVHDESGTECASELMHKYLLPGNQIAKQLSILAHNMDFMVGDNYLPPISELIQYYRTLSNTQKRLRRLAVKAATGILWDTKMQSDYIKYLGLCKIEKKRALSSLKIIQIGKFNVALIQVSKYLQTSLFSKEIFNTTGADVAILYNDQGKVSIRRNNNKISCRSIASLLADGGGHEFAAGGKIRWAINNTKDIPRELEQVVRKSLSASVFKN